MEIKRVLCPTDLSEGSAQAAEQAVIIAGYQKAGITALHVLDSAVPSPDHPEIERLRRQTAALFQAAKPAGVPVEVVVDVGLPVERILDRAGSSPATLIVMGTHGRSGFQHLVLGSVTEKVLRKATCPVLTVPPRAAGTSHLPFRHVLCAVDFSDASLSAVKWAASLAGESGAGLTLLHVLEWPWNEPPPPAIDELPFEQGAALTEFRRYSEERARKRLESIVPAAIPASRVTTRVTNGKPYAQILQVAVEERSDLIVIGVHGRNPVDMALFGSTTNQIVRRATCPVLTLRP